MFAATIGLVMLLQSAAIGDFSYVERTDPLEDTLQVGVVLQEPNAKLTIACDHSRSRTIYVVLETRGALAVAPSAIVEGLMPFNYRVDADPPQSALVRYDVASTVLEGAQARAFAERLAHGSHVFVRVLGISGNIDADFSASGAKDAIAKVAERCGDQRLISRLARNQ